MAENPSSLPQCETFVRKIARKVTPDDLELAWMAGFFDGEGYVGIGYGPATGHYALHVVVTQKDAELLVPFRNRFGGRVRCHAATGVHAWGVTAGSAASFLSAIRPYLRGKGDQADIAVAFQARRGRQGVRAPAGRDAIDERDFLTLKALKRREPAASEPESPESAQFALELEDVA